MNYQIKIMDYWLFYIKISAFTFLFQINIAEYNNDWIINANFSLLGTKLNIKLKTLGESKETTEENKFYILIPVDTRDGGAWWAAISGVAQSRTRLKQLSSSSSREQLQVLFLFLYDFNAPGGITELNLFIQSRRLKELCLNFLW